MHSALQNTQSVNRLKDVLSDLPEIDVLTVVDPAYARELLEAMSAYVGNILGGNQAVCALLDEWQQEFGVRYARLYA